jgi:hypothetical protein
MLNLPVSYSRKRTNIFLIRKRTYINVYNLILKFKVMPNQVLKNKQVHALTRCNNDYSFSFLFLLWVRFEPKIKPYPPTLNQLSDHPRERKYNNGPLVKEDMLILIYHPQLHLLCTVKEE